MRLLFDQNLSPRLKRKLEGLFPGSLHVRDVGLATAEDLAIWEYAKGYGLTIISKDSDFRQLSFALGQPPKVVWIQSGNCSTSEIESLLRDRFANLKEFHEDREGAFLALS